MAADPPPPATGAPPPRVGPAPPRVGPAPPRVGPAPPRVGQAPPTDRRARVRLAVLVVALLVAFGVFTVGGLLDVAQVRAAVATAGPAAPVVYVVAAVMLAAVLVPGPVLAGASGLLFGPVLGTAVTLAAAIGTAVLALHVGRAGGRDGARSLVGAERSAALEALLARRGLLAVVLQRLAPGVPDAPASYAFGALGVRTGQIVLGTALGAAPRAFAYTAVGATLDDPASPLGVAALVVWVAVTVAGLEVARRAARTRRR